jgi:D-lyxose ketol-isomerase
MRIVSKVWGHEEILLEWPELTRKNLVIDPRKRCSLHYHPVKREAFIVRAGTVWVELQLPDERHMLVAGTEDDTTVIVLEPGRPHRFWSHAGGVLEEVSTRHDDDDVVRLEPSGDIP